MTKKPLHPEAERALSALFDAMQIPAVAREPWKTVVQRILSGETLTAGETICSLAEQCDAVALSKKYFTCVPFSAFEAGMTGRICTLDEWINGVSPHITTDEFVLPVRPILQMVHSLKENGSFRLLPRTIDDHPILHTGAVTQYILLDTDNRLLVWQAVTDTEQMTLTDDEFENALVNLRRQLHEL